MIRLAEKRNHHARNCKYYLNAQADLRVFDDASFDRATAGCKVAIGTRLKRAGMHWTVRGSNAIIALRCCKLSGRFEDFWERRSQWKAAA